VGDGGFISKPKRLTRNRGKTRRSEDSSEDASCGVDAGATWRNGQVDGHDGFRDEAGGQRWEEGRAGSRSAKENCCTRKGAKTHCSKRRGRRPVEMRNERDIAMLSLTCWIMPIARHEEDDLHVSLSLGLQPSSCCFRRE
jgi:hypothetical protein